ncbi:NRAMP family divalent metal transporter [Nocardioides sp. Kera G14]|uniref:NRAMP family divalent metal transporter n=1 Tax=Nocardioides sp. Kera G14 TaxID=2884264 RepID=UPI001D0FE712|nr:divalent metal cation transporter [Nocardioides sp. Kera G14]UDY25185.1 divalent metal cation transporter [Nocardioides sp. Kera G14]
MKKVLGLLLGVLTAIGGFVDIGDLVTNTQVGARFGMSLAWATILAVIGICVFSEMSGRIAAISGRATFDLVRERLGPAMGMVNLLGSMGVTLLTFVAEIGGVALAVQLITSVDYLLLFPFIGLTIWLILWRAKFSFIENAFGLLGLGLLVFVAAVFHLGPDWSTLGHSAISFSKPAEEHWATWWYYAIALLGSGMTPYEVFFFSSGGVEEHWSPKDLPEMRANVLIGFPLGGVLALALTACAMIVLGPLGISVDSLSQVGLPVALTFGKLGLAIALLGFVAATFGAACETGLSVGYSLGQYFGWQWGKYVRSDVAARFHVVLFLATLVAMGVLATTIDPIKVTEMSVVFSAVALPLTYFPILVVANDRDYMGEHANGRFANVLATIFLIIVTVAAIAAIPLMIWTRMGA